MNEPSETYRGYVIRRTGPDTIIFFHPGGADENGQMIGWVLDQERSTEFEQVWIEPDHVVREASSFEEARAKIDALLAVEQ